MIAQRFLAEHCEGAEGAQRKRKLASEFADETVAIQAIKDRLAGYHALVRAGVISRNLVDEAEMTNVKLESVLPLLSILSTPHILMNRLILTIDLLHLMDVIVDSLTEGVSVFISNWRLLV